MNKQEIKCSNFAIKAHNNVNQKYGKHSYEYHLKKVRDFAAKYIYYVDEKDQDIVLSACWLHDTIEDAQITYNDIKAISNEKIADLAYALTNEKGKNRDQRANGKYYFEMRLEKYATFIKICDRLANTSESLKTKSNMFLKYKNEYDKFKLLVSIPKFTLSRKFFKYNFIRYSFYFQNEYLNLYNNHLLYSEMWDELDNLYKMK